MKLTKEQENISRKNKRKVREYFGIYGDKSMVLHHIDPSWKHDDIERYIQWNIEDVVVMPVGEHVAYHNSLNDKWTAERRKKVSDTLTGREMSDEFYDNMKKFATGRKHYHKGNETVFIKPEEIPHYESLGYEPGRGNYPKNRKKRTKKENTPRKYWYTNGINNLQAVECPEGYWKGMTKKKNKVI